MSKEEVHELQWDIFETIHGNRRQRCVYGGIACVRNGYYNGKIWIMPAHPKTDIGKGPGQPIFVYEDEIEYYDQSLK